MVMIQPRTVRPATGGPWYDRPRAAAMREADFPATAFAGPTTFVLDLRGATPTPGVLLEYLVPLAQAIRGGLYGNVKLVVCTQDSAVAQLITLVAGAYALPLFVAPAPDRLAEAEPVGELTATDRATLAAIVRAGGRVSASQLARAASIEATAANNRLTNLERKGYVYRVNRPGREGDVYADPRVPDPQQALSSILQGMSEVLPPEEYARAAARMRQALEREPHPDEPQVY